MSAQTSSASTVKSPGYAWAILGIVYLLSVTAAMLWFSAPPMAQDIIGTYIVQLGPENINANFGMLMTDIDCLTGELLYERLRAMELAEAPEDVENYRWHSTSHHLGFDTHDDNDYTMPIAPGMVFTMEVGIYVPQWGEGVRIEDNILMTEQGCENLSRQIPRSVEDIEALMSKEE